MRKTLSFSLFSLLLISTGIFSIPETQTAYAAEPITELIIYDDALQNNFIYNDWGNTPAANQLYTGTVFDGSFALQKNLAIFGGSGEFMSFTSPTGVNTADFTHFDFYAQSLSPEGAHIVAKFATKPWAGTSEEVAIEIPSGTWTHFQIPFADFGSTIVDKQYEGIAFRGGGPNADFQDSDNDVVFDLIKVVKLDDKLPPTIISTALVSVNEIKISFNEKLSSTDAKDPNNYVITSSDDLSYSSGKIPISVSLGLNERDVSLTVATLTEGATYTITISNIKDLSDNVMPTTTTSVTVIIPKVTLNVDAGTAVRPFNPMMRGSQLACWMHEQANKPGPDNVANLDELTGPLNPGIIRYCGGLWANNTGWDRLGQAPNNGNWQFTDPNTGITHPYTYGHTYKPAWIDNLALFLNKIGAQAMIQANLCDDNPTMWADMVRYANVENNYNFKYWELSNEIDLDQDLRQQCFGTTDQTIAAQEYAKRYVKYTNAMKAVDPTIKIMGPVTANYYSAPTWFSPLVTEMKNAGLNLDVLSWHWYQVFDWVSDPNSQTYDFGSLEALLNYNKAITSLNFPYNKGDIITDPEHWLYRSRRIFSEFTAQAARNTYLLPNFPNAELAITENNAHGSAFTNSINGNHMGAVWMADILGRAAYNGLDINIWYELYDGGAGPTDVTYGMIYPDNDLNPSKLFIRPTYYSMLLYGQWFGDMMVESSTSDALQNTVVWATTDSTDPGKLKLMLININPNPVEVTINLASFNPVDAIYYEMTSADPLSMDPALALDSGVTTINGVTIDTTIGNVQTSIDAIPAKILTNLVPNFRHTLPLYSVTAMVVDSVPTPDTNPPFISNPSPTEELASGTQQVTISVTTNENAFCNYDTVPGTSYSAMPFALSSVDSFVHTADVTDLTDGSTFNYYVRCVDDAGNFNTVDNVISFSIALPPICALQSATWSTSSAVEGEVVTLTVTGTGCDVDDVGFLIVEDDDFGGTDPVVTQPALATFVGGTAISTWIAEYQPDGIGGMFDPPEYFFTATLIGDTSKNIQSGLLSVDKAPADSTPPSDSQTTLSATLALPYIFLDKPQKFSLTGTNLSTTTDFTFRLKQQGISQFQVTTKPTTETSLEIDFSIYDTTRLIPGFYEIELTRESDQQKLTHAKQLLITKLGDLWSSSATESSEQKKDGKIDIFDVSRLLSKWNSTAPSDLAEADINSGPNDVSLGTIDLFDANKLMANWSQ